MNDFPIKALVFSDSHGIVSKMEQACKKHSDIKYVIHLGDYVRDANKLICSFSDISLFSICGNCDFGYKENSQKIIILGEKRIFITHGHYFSVKSGLQNLIDYSAQKQDDVTLFGHTHIPYCQKHGNALVANPGSVTKVSRTYGILSIDEKINFEILECSNV